MRGPRWWSPSATGRWTHNAAVRSRPPLAADPGAPRAVYDPRPITIRCATPGPACVNSTGGEVHKGPPAFGSIFQI